MKDHVILLPNPHRDVGLTLTGKILGLLKAAGQAVCISPLFTEENDLPLPDWAEPVPVAEALPGAKLVICFGGDGTLLRAARAVLGTEIPLLGVNLGSKGFLADLQPDELDRLLGAARGEYVPERRMMLDVTLLRQGKTLLQDTVLNDVAVNGIANAIRIRAAGDDSVITEFSGDGIICATPTGSTAYSMSAGGPLVEPTARNIILTPICAHALMSRSFVLAPERRVELIPTDLRGKRAVLSLDGRPIELQHGDKLQVTCSKHETLLARVSGRSFYDIAYEKLGERI